MGHMKSQGGGGRRRSRRKLPRWKSRCARLGSRKAPHGRGASFYLPSAASFWNFALPYFFLPMKAARASLPTFLERARKREPSPSGAFSALSLEAFEGDFLIFFYELRVAISLKGIDLVDLALVQPQPSPLP